jgi:hypothetical protein
MKWPNSFGFARKSIDSSFMVCAMNAPKDALEIADKTAFDVADNRLF